MTALLGEVTAERHFSSHGECEKHKPKVHIKHNISFYALKHFPTHTTHTRTHTYGNTISHAHNLSATRSKGGPNPSGNTI